jgi:hypothetical protein
MLPAPMTAIFLTSSISIFSPQYNYLESFVSPIRHDSKVTGQSWLNASAHSKSIYGGLKVFLIPQ